MSAGRLLAALLAGLVLVGCASMKPGRGFDDVTESVSERTGMRVHWNNGSREDQEARSAVQSLLEQELTADGAVQIALLNNRDLQATYEELHVAQADMVRSGLLKNPVFSGELKFGLDSAGTGIELGLAQEFLSLLYLPLRKGLAGAAFESAKLRVTGEVLGLAGQTRTAFYDLQAAEQMREMRATVLEAMDASYDLSKRLREAGNITELDLTSERAMFEQSKIDLARAEAAAQQQREGLNELMGLWGEQTDWRAAARLPALPQDGIPAEGLEGRAVERSLELGVARRDLEVAARTAGIARPLGFLSDLEVGIVAEREPEGDWSLGPSVAFPIPLFDQGQASFGSARARLRQVAEHYAATAVRVRARARGAHAAAIGAQERARYYEQVLLPLRQQIVDQTQLQYNAMQVSAFQLLQARRDQILTGAEYVETLRDYWVARAALDQILSGRLPASSRMELASETSSRPVSSGQGGH
jgi:outer membrane protein, heavy metal efflux system